MHGWRIPECMSILCGFQDTIKKDDKKGKGKGASAPEAKKEEGGEGEGKDGEGKGKEGKEGEAADKPAAPPEEPGVILNPFVFFICSFILATSNPIIIIITNFCTENSL